MGCRILLMYGHLEHQRIIMLGKGNLHPVDLVMSDTFARGAAFVLLCALANAGGVFPATLEVQVLVVDGGPPAAATVIARPADISSSAPEVVATFAPPGEAVLEIPGPAAAWVVTAAAEGFWSNEETLWVEDSGRAELELWPAAWIEGRVQVADGSKAPGTLGVRFERRDPERPDAGPAGSLECAIREEAFRCGLPAGVLDLRLRSIGFVAEYLWDQTLRAGETRDLGTLLLRPGASLVGWVETEDRAPIGSRTELRLRPGSPRPSPHGDTGRARMLPIDISPNERGFFHFRGLAPGSYELLARQPGYTVAQTEVTLYADAEAELREPLVLTRPRDLDVFLEPPVDPWGRKWRLELTRLDPGSNPTGRPIEASVSSQGIWSHGGIPAGPYRLQIRDAAGNQWAAQRVELVDARERVFVDIPLVEVEGSVRLGETPLAADVVFGPNAPLSISFRAEEGGGFSGWLPREGDWDVSVSSERPPVRRHFPAVEVRRLQQSPVARVDLELPETRLEGRVVTEDGRPAPGLVNVTSADAWESVQLFAGADGAFAGLGLPTGATRLYAESYGAVSDRVEIQLEEGETVSVELLVRKESQVTVELRSPYGPVPGAVMMAPKGPGVLWRLHSTDARGRAVVDLVPGTSRLRLRVFPRGFSFRAISVSVEPGDLVVVPVDQLGGTLALEMKGVRALLDPAEPEAVLLHGGDRFAASLLNSMWDAVVEPTSDGLRVVVANMQAGEYSLCLVPVPGRPAPPVGSGSCATGSLAPLGELRLGVSAAGGEAGPDGTAPDR